MNRCTLADDVTIMIMTMTTIMMMDITEENKMSGMNHIAIAIPAVVAEIQVKTATIAEVRGDHGSLVTLQRESTILDTVRGPGLQHRLIDNTSRFPAHDGQTLEHTRPGNLPTTILNNTNNIATSSNTTLVDNTTLRHITNNHTT